MKILCVCEHGNVRSVAMAYVLKYLGHDAVALSSVNNSKQLLLMLADWADLIYIPEDRVRFQLKWPVNNDKIVNIMIGPDQWGYARIKELIQQLKSNPHFRKNLNENSKEVPSELGQDS